MADADRGLIFDAHNLMMEEYVDHWLLGSVSDTVKTTSFERYEQIIRLHLKSTLGRVKLNTLTPAHVRSLYREKLKAGLSARYVHTTLHKALGLAPGVFLYLNENRAICRNFLSRGGGTRTHTPSQDPDFKSDNPRPGTSCPIPLCGLGKRRTWPSQYLAS